MSWDNCYLIRGGNQAYNRLKKLGGTKFGEDTRQMHFGILTAALDMPNDPPPPPNTAGLINIDWAGGYTF